MCVCVCVCVCVERERKWGCGGGGGRDRQTDRQRHNCMLSQTCLPRNTCQYSRLPVSTFFDLWPDCLVCFVLFCFGAFFAMHHQSIKAKKVSKDNFAIIYLLRTVCELTFSVRQMHYKTGTQRHSDASVLFLRLLKSFWIKDTRTPLFCLRLLKSHLLVLKSFWIKDRRKNSSKAMHRVCCFRWCRHVISWAVDIWLELVSLVSCILPPVSRFCAVTCYGLRCLRTHHMWRLLTSVKLWTQSRCSLI